MKDLKRYITNKDKIKYRRNIKLNFDYDNPTDVEFLAYCAFNSFEKLDNYAENFSNYLGTEEYLTLVFHTFNANAYEDYDLPETFVKDLMLDALFPNYKFDDIEVYFEQLWDGYMEESHIDRRYFISFVEAYKKKMKKKR